LFVFCLVLGLGRRRRRRERRNCRVAVGESGWAVLVEHHWRRERLGILVILEFYFLSRCSRGDLSISSWLKDKLDGYFIQQNVLEDRHLEARLDVCLVYYRPIRIYTVLVGIQRKYRAI